MFYFIILALLTLVGCDHPKPPPPPEEFSPAPRGPSFNWHRINSRDDGDPLTRFPLYYAKVPSDWVRIDPPSNESIVDTTKALCEFLIEDGEKKVRITIHNFPSNDIDERIPPISQIDRWKGQFQSLVRSQTHIVPEIHNGFIGLFLECKGTLDNVPTKLLGWAMQLAPEYYTLLSFDNSLFSRQARADYTIKAVGNPELMDKNQPSIMFFAYSFQLIEELPEPQPP